MPARSVRLMAPASLAAHTTFAPAAGAGWGEARPPPGAARCTVSLVIPTYNGKQHLTVCLAAIERQRRSPDETIVVDDASTDGTRDFLSARFPWVNVVTHEQNRGFAGAANTGMRAA